MTSPVDYLMGLSRRLGLDPPEQLILGAAEILGQRLFAPPSVKGWEGGLAWMTTANMMNRANLAGVLMGQVDLDVLATDAEYGAPPDMAETEGRNPFFAGPVLAVQIIQESGWTPEYSLVQKLQKMGADGDARTVEYLAEDLLAIEPPAETLAGLVAHFAELRAEEGVPEDGLAATPDRMERALRRLAHVILSLPEAQLN